MFSTSRVLSSGVGSNVREVSITFSRYLSNSSRSVVDNPSSFKIISTLQCFASFSCDTSPRTSRTVSRSPRLSKSSKHTIVFCTDENQIGPSPPKCPLIHGSCCPNQTAFLPKYFATAKVLSFKVLRLGSRGPSVETEFSNIANLSSSRDVIPNRETYE